MAVVPEAVLNDPRQMGAALVVVGNSSTAEDLDPVMVVTWFLSEGVPFTSAEEAHEALECTRDLLAQIDDVMAGDESFVPDGFSSEHWAFFREALRDGVQAIEVEVQDLEVLEEAADQIETLYDALVMTGVVEAPVIEYEPVDLTE